MAVTHIPVASGRTYAPAGPGAVRSTVERSGEDITQGPLSAMDVSRGSEVYTLDGRHLGTVAEVWVSTQSHGYLPKSKTLMADYGPISGTRAWFETSDGYVEVVEVIGPKLRRTHFIDLNDSVALHRESLIVPDAATGSEPASQGSRFNRAA